MLKLLKNNSTRIVAIMCLLGLYVLAKPSTINNVESEKLSSTFSFDSSPIEIVSDKYNTIRVVHDDYMPIQGWISSVGAAGSFADLDGNGLYNDLILTEPRTDKVYWLMDGKKMSKTFDVNTLKYDEKTMAPMGSVVADFDENGEVDLMIYYWGRSPILFLQKNGLFAEQELLSDVECWFSNACVLSDFNGDGHVDILVGNYFPNAAAVLDPLNKEKQYMQHTMSRADNGGKNRLFLYNKESETGFKEVMGWRDVLEIEEDWTLALAAADLNGDLLPEIYVANDFGPDRLLLNCSENGKIKFKVLEGERTFTTMSSCVLGHDSFKGMGADFADLNGDGLMDIYVSNIAAEYALEESHFLFLNNGKEITENGKAPFDNKSESLGLSRSSWGWDCKMADFNNDGTLEAVQATGFIKGDVDRWPELHEIAMGNDELLSNPGNWHKFQENDDLCGYEHNPFFVKSKTGKYFDVADQLGIDQKTVTRGIAISDIDHDGDLDFVAANQWEESQLYINNVGDKKSSAMFLGLDIRNENSSDQHNALGGPLIGCQAKVLRINGKELAEKKQMIGYVNGGNGHSGVSSPEVHFGLGDIKADSEIEIELKWIDKNGKQQREIKTLTPGWHQISL